MNFELLEYHHHLNRNEIKENVINTATKKHARDLVGFYEPREVFKGCKETSCSKNTRQTMEIKTSHLPPNRYDVPTEPFLNLKGAGGAYWHKLRVERAHEEPKKTAREQLMPANKRHTKGRWRFYDVDRYQKYVSENCQKHKGVFLGNARNRRPTSRLMCNSILTCYKEPTDAEPASYTPVVHEIMHNIKQRPQPFIFLRRSCVPQKTNSIHLRKISYTPGPGRYETRYKSICPCTSGAKKIFAPCLQLEIDAERRKKFRREPFKKIKKSLYCSPDWQHVIGRGHRYLFKGAARIRPAADSKFNKKPEKYLQLYAGAQYINMIKYPTQRRVPMSTRIDQDKQKPKEHNIFYQTLERPIKKHQLRNNKKVAFLSGVQRWKNDEFHILDIVPAEKAREKLPTARQLRNHPVMRINKSDIKSRFSTSPKYRTSASQINGRKRLFKFLPLPEARILATVKDTKTMQKIEPFYGKRLKQADFFKSDIELNTTYSNLIKVN